MARAKLGLSSSLEAARLLSTTEGYQRTGPHAADLAAASPASDKRLYRPLIFGGLMTLVAAAIVAIASQSSGSLAEVGTTPDTFRMAPASDFVDGTPEELRAFAEERFRTMDKDGSGFVERDEAPDVQIRMTDVEWAGDGPPPREWLEQQSRRVPLDPVMAKAAYIAKSDADSDGKLSFDEYLAFRNSGFDAKQVPVSWREQRQAQR
jgi:hypothetical protein